MQTTFQPTNLTVVAKLKSKLEMLSCDTKMCWENTSGEI